MKKKTIHEGGRIVDLTNGYPALAEGEALFPFAGGRKGKIVDVTAVMAEKDRRKRARFGEQLRATMSAESRFRQRG